MPTGRSHSHWQLCVAVSVRCVPHTLAPVAPQKRNHVSSGGVPRNYLPELHRRLIVSEHRCQRFQRGVGPLRQRHTGREALLSITLMQQRRHSLADLREDLGRRVWIARDRTEQFVTIPIIGTGLRQQKCQRARRRGRVQSHRDVNEHERRSRKPVQFLRRGGLALGCVEVVLWSMELRLRHRRIVPEASGVVQRAERQFGATRQASMERDPPIRRILS